jgi:hypothetical protein
LPSADDATAHPCSELSLIGHDAVTKRVRRRVLSGGWERRCPVAAAQGGDAEPHQIGGAEVLDDRKRGSRTRRAVDGRQG